jgi:signal transduction histidine kinase
LSALQLVVKESARLPAEHRELLLGAIGRIREIADALLTKDKARKAAPALLAELIEPLLAEKKSQFSPHKGLKLRLKGGEGLKARVVPAEFSRLLSNLIDNAVQALEGEPGEVTVSLAEEKGFARLAVIDDGKGIPPEILSKLGRRGETHGKAGGSGLGLHHARSCAEAWGGRLEISSKPGRGTTVAVFFPL